MAYVTDGAIGIDLDSPSSADVFNGSRLPGATLGETHEGSENTEWQFVLAGAAISKGALVAIGTGFTALPVTATTTLMGLGLGFAQTSFTASQYGYVAKRGQNIFIRLSGGLAAAAGVPLYTTDTAGVLSTATASASQFQVWGVFATTAFTGTTASANTGNAQYPMLRRPA
jgi:hypothetical protein